MIPLPKRKVNIPHFVEEFVELVTAALPWFEQFATPESCKANLEKFITPGTPAFVDAHRVLNSLMRRP